MAKALKKFEVVGVQPSVMFGSAIKYMGFELREQFDNKAVVHKILTCLIDEMNEMIEVEIVEDMPKDINKYDNIGFVEPTINFGAAVKGSGNYASAEVRISGVAKNIYADKNKPKS